jgi:phosphoribosylaminoimidazole-succinocarboxamide synthase
LVNCNPDPNVAVGHLCDPFKWLFVVIYLVMQQENMQVVKKNYLRCSYTEGLKENDQFHLLYTYNQSRDNGAHDDISREAILSNGRLLVKHDNFRRVYKSIVSKRNRDRG